MAFLERRYKKHEASYKQAREKYKPEKVRVLFIGESPPRWKEKDEPRYFYFEKVEKRDHLFKSVMKALFPREFQEYEQGKSKARLLKKFKKHGFFLVDACETPINQHKEGAFRNLLVKKSLPSLVKKVKQVAGPETKIIFIKDNVHRIAAKKLEKEGFQVLHQEPLKFPYGKNAVVFQEKVRKMLGEEGLLP
jgi:hypothetical protein